MGKITDAIVRIEAETTSFNRKMKEAGLQVDKFSKAATSSLNILKSTLGTLGVGLGIGVFVHLTKSAFDTADAIDKVSKQAGVSAQALQELRFAADQNGVSMDQMDDGLRRFNRRLGLAAQNTGPALAAFRQLGINVADANGHAVNAETAFNAFVHQLQQVQSPAQRAALAAQAFGEDAGPRLLVLLNQGVGGIDKLRSQAEKIGAVLGNDAVKQAARAKDAMGRVSASFTGLANAAAIQLGPSLVAVANTLTDDIPRAVNVSARAIAAAKSSFFEFSGGMSKFSAEVSQFLAEHTGGAISEQFASAARKHWKDAQKAFEGSAHEYEVQIAALDDKTRQFVVHSGQGFKNIIVPGIQASTAAAKELSKAGAEVKDDWDMAMDLIDQQFKKLHMDHALQIAGLEQIQQKTKEIGQGAQQMGYTFSSAFEDAVLQAKKLSDVMQGLLQDIARTILHQTVTAPLQKFVSGQVSSLFPGFASGTDYAPGGLAIVGEQGPELVNLPRGSQVIPNGRGMASGVSVNIQNIDARGSTDPAATAAAVRRAVNASVATIRDMKTRGKLPEFA